MAEPIASPLTIRLATEADIPAMRRVMRLAIEQLQRGFLSEAEIAASRAVMGLDTQLVADRTYFIVESGGEVAGCGGWSRRATLYGGDHSTELREPRILDRTTEAARVRAMYTHPHHARRGIGRLILAKCEEAASADGFGSVQLMATLAGQPLYHACGYSEIARIVNVVGGVGVPLIHMQKHLHS